MIRTGLPNTSSLSVCTALLLLFLGSSTLVPTAALAQLPDTTVTEPESKQAPPETVQLSFSGAEIDVIVKWLAEMTGKSIIKHKDVKVKLNIISSKEIPRQEGIRLVYRAMALEGFSALESNSLIVIVPEAMEGKVSPELFNGSDTVAQGKQTVIKFFDLKHTRAENLKDQLKAVLSEKAKFEVDARANKVIVTDYAENVRFLAELIKELDVPEATATLVEVFPLTHTEAANISELVKSIYEEQQGDAGQIRVLADDESNRLVVTAPRVRMEEVRDLLQTLDTTRPADVAVRVLPLQHVQAEDLQRELRNMYRKLSGKSLKETIEIAANAVSNSLIVLSSQTNYDAIQELIQKLDTEDAEQKAMKIFSLRHADAQDVAEQLDDLHALNRRNSNMWFYSSRSRDTNGEIRFVAMRRTNEVVAVGPPGALDRIQETIDMLDKPAGDEALAPRIYPLRFVDAENLATVLNDLFVKKEERPYWYYDEPQEDRDVGRLFGKVRIAAVPASNSLIITTNSTENFSALENILSKLDVRNQENETTLNIPLQHAKATQVSNNLNILFAPPGAPNRRGNNNNQQNNQPRNSQNPVNSDQDFSLDDNDQEEAFFPWLGSGNQQARRGDRPAKPVSDLIGMVRIVPDNRTNSLLVTTSPHYFPQVLGLLGELDVPTAQVMIEAKIVEISTDDRDRLGVRWSPDGGLVFDPDDFDGSLSASSTVDYSRIFVGTALADATRSGILNSGVNLDLLVQFLRKNTNSKVRAEPRINVADNERGKLFVGARVPFISSSLRTTEGGENVQFDYVDVGIILEVTPHINSKGDVTVKIRVEASQIRQGETLFGGAILDTRNYRTEMTVASATTMVLGGILQREESEVIRKVPLFGDIPLLGYFFKKKDTVVRDVELLVFLRPIVARTREEAAKLLEAERNRSESIREWESSLEKNSDY